MPIVRMPDGVEVRFPDDMPRDQIRDMIASKFPDAAQQAQQPASGPWDKYKPQAEAGPWQKYAAPASGPYSSSFANDGTVGSTFARGGAALPEEKTLGGAGMTWMENAVSGIPIVGPSIQKGSDYIGSNLYGLVTGQDPSQIREEVNQRREGRNETYPASAFSGQLAANIAPMSAIGRTAAGAQSLGITGTNWLTRAGNSAASSAIVSGADTAARGGGAEEIMGGMVRSGAIGAAIPALGAGISKGLETFGNRNMSTIGAMLNPAKEAERRVGTAFLRDAQADPKSIMSAVDRQIAQANNIPIVNADIGGETTRALARSVANQSPEARAVIERTASDRFAGQGQRATEFIKKIVGGNADDIGYRHALQEQARYHNKAAYDAAYSAPHAQQVYTKGLQDLMQSPSLRKAVADVPTRSADRGAVQGFKEIGNPFTMNSQGAYVLRQKADGTLVAPNLQFWDHVKRNLDSQIGTAQKGGDDTFAADLTAIKNKLTSELDTAVPAYKQARQGASGFFGADDALDAGRKFVNSPRSVPEVRQAFNAFNGTEKQAFATGYASELIDRIKATNDRSNVINQVFKSQSARESMEMVLGAQKMKQIEAYVRVEDLADRLRGAMGNSTTARQLAELGIGAGAGAYGAYTGDWGSALTVGALTAGVTRGGRWLKNSANDKVLQQMANLLTKEHPQALIIAAQQAAIKPTYMRALEKLSEMLAIPARGGAVMVGQ